MKKLNNNLDERQEQKMLHIEKFGCWFAFWALLISIFIQQGIYGVTEIRAVAGEWIIFMCLALYLLGACIKNGIWDRHLKANPKTNIVCSLIASIVFAGIFAFINYTNYRALEGAAATFVVIAIMLFVLCFAALSVCTMIYRKRAKDLENEYADEDSMNPEDE